VKKDFYYGLIVSDERREKIPCTSHVENTKKNREIREFRL
jgi:hypothetical protein